MLGEVAPDEGEEGAGVGDEGRGWWDVGSGDLGLAVEEAGCGVRFEKGREVVVDGWKRSGEGGEKEGWERDRAWVSNDHGAR